MHMWVLIIEFFSNWTVCLVRALGHIILLIVVISPVQVYGNVTRPRLVLPLGLTRRLLSSKED